eukprot:CAMPEP_0116975638 /NCGR_PEP_ID=MMETSP0467-20121206/55934_1 /TAXON_ID=283647 /ORGANISM="Mesodinium pulex, Strain SPMC105" /LENGTH=95 /DNA_ID=CAMNT_0004668113 /DNA_START=505 /DNA_END=792 /DNA_ORIENTATION=-
MEEKGDNYTEGEGDGEDQQKDMKFQEVEVDRSNSRVNANGTNNNSSSRTPQKLKSRLNEQFLESLMHADTNLVKVKLPYTSLKQTSGINQKLYLS